MTTTTIWVTLGGLMEIMGWEIKFLQPLLGTMIETFNHLLKTLAPIPSLTGCLQSSLFIWMPIQVLDVFVPWYPHLQWPCSLSPATPLMHLPTRLWWGDLALEYLLICILHLSPCHSLCSCLEHLSVLLSHVASQLKAILERTHTFSPPATVSPHKPDPSYLPSFCLLIH